VYVYVYVYVYEDVHEDVHEDVYEDVSLAEPEPRTSELNQGQVVSRGFLVSRRDGAKPLEVVEEDLDEVADAVKAPVEARLPLSLGFRVDHRPHVAMSNLGTEFVRVVPGVPDE
jgi:hypothetical protein